MISTATLRLGPILRCALVCVPAVLAAACNNDGGATLSQASDASSALSTTTSAPGSGTIASGRDASRCIAAGTVFNGTRPTLAACDDDSVLSWLQPGNGQLRLGGKCLDVVDGKAQDGAAVQLWDCFDDNTNQRWTVQNKQIVWTGHNLCIDVKDGNFGQGAALQLWTCFPENDNQKWTLKKSAEAADGGGSAQAPAPSAPAAGGSRASCKRGLSADAGAALALNAADLALISPNVTWWYNWYLRAGDASVTAANDKLGLDYVQMVSVRSTDFAALASNMPANARYLLTFNEPNFYSQSNITPEDAAALWPKIEAFADQHNLLIVSPAMNYCSGACNVEDPFVWMDRFFAACKNCRVDHIAVHAYTCDVPTLRSMSIDPFVKKYHRPIWLTEFDCADSGNIRNDVASQKAFMTAAVASLEADPNIFRYAWFMAKANGDWSNIALLDSRGQLTELGRHYLSLPQACTP
jgi:hypothetical protein